MQTISTSPALKEWLKRYIRINKKKNPEAERYKSISALYRYIIENAIKILETGKTLDEFKDYVDKEFKESYDKFTFKAAIPIYEMAVELNRFEIDFKRMLEFLLMIRNYYLKTSVFDMVELKKIFERLKKRVLTNNTVKNFTLELIPQKNPNFRGIVEFSAYYRNLHYENCKFNAALLGLLGLKIINFDYAEKDIYSRTVFETTPLFFQEDLNLNEKKNLIKENISFLINYNYILEDDDRFLWLKMVKDSDVVLSFNSDSARERWFSEIEKDILKFGSKNEIPLKMLKFFHRIHWIKLESEEGLSFTINLLKEVNKQDLEFLLKYLSRFGTLDSEKGKYYLRIST